MATPLNAKVDPDTHAHSTQVIKTYLDDYAVGRLTADELSARLTSLCSGNSEAAWEALSLLDQYNRRGLIATELFRSIKATIHAVVFGSPTVERNKAGPLNSASIRSSRDTAARATDKSQRNDAHHDEEGSASELDDGPIRSLNQSPNATVVFDAVEPARTSDPQSVLQTPKLRAGSVLCGRYVLIAPLGRGGMSTVFKALDRERAKLPEQDRYVAIKLLRDEIIARPEARAALEREFKQLLLLSHPNIVRVYDCESHAGHYFIVMELLSGELLERVLERVAPRRLRLADALAIIREIGVALAHAHDHGIVHADLKPGNVMLMAHGELRILDFGLSSSLLQEPWISDGRDPSALIAFTPGYSSPERVRGLSPDPRDDLYSLACIAFELVTGRPVATEGKAASRRQIMRALREVRGLSSRQRRTIAHGLAPTRARRSPTVRAWLADFDLAQAAPHIAPLRELRADDSTRQRSARWKVLLALLLLGVSIALIARVFMQNMSEPVAPAIREASPAAEQSRQPKAVAEPSASPTPAPTPRPVQENSSESTHASEPEPPNSTAADAASKPTETRKQILAPPSLALSDEEYTVASTSSVARLTVKRSGSLDKETIFHWRTIGGSARPERDYVSFADAADRFAPGQRRPHIFIPIVNDSPRRGPEYFEVELTDAQSAALGSITRATVVIVNEE